VKLLLTLIIALVIGLGFGLVLQGEPGYLLLAHGSWRIETSLVVALAGIAVLFLLFYSLFRLLGWAVGTGPRWRGWRGRRRRMAAHRELTRGVSLLLEGRWGRAEKMLLKHIDDSEMPLLNHLAAAWAAQELGDPGRRDQQLRLARGSDNSAAAAVDLVQAEADFRGGRIDAALAAAELLHQALPKHPWGLRQLARIYYQTENWHGLLALLPALTRHAGINSDDAVVLARRCHRALLSQSVELADGHWQSLEKNQRSEPALVFCFARALINAGQGLRAERLLLQGLEQCWDAGLLAELINLPSQEPSVRLARLEGWQQQHPDDPQLLLAIAATCRSLAIWGKARELLERSIALKPSRESRRQLAELLLQLGEYDAALAEFKAAALVTAPAISLPVQSRGAGYCPCHQPPL